MDRRIVYPGQIPLDTDILHVAKDAYYGDGWMGQASVGIATQVVGLAVTPTGPASLQVNVAPGAIFSLQTVDASAYGSLGTDANQVVKMGIAPASSTLTITPPGTVGQSINYLVQVQFSETDATPVVLPYYNASNPSVAWSGPNNTGTAQNTVRKDSCVIQLKAGTPAATGSQTTPAPDAGYTGIYVITCAQGQTTITSGNIALLATAPYFPTLPQVPTAVQAGQWLFAVAAGSVNVYTATLAPIPPALVTGMEILVNFGTPNTTTTPTLNVNGLGAKTIVKQSSAAVANGDVTGYMPLIYDGTNWRINGFAKSDVPVISAGLVTIYVRTDGSDANNGSANNSANAFLTISAALSFATTHFILGAGVLIQLGNTGTYAVPGIIPLVPGGATIQGDIANQTSYILSGAGPGVGNTGLVAANAGQVTLKGLAILNSGTINSNVIAQSGGSLILQNVTFQTSVGGVLALIYSAAGGSIIIGAGCVISGNANLALNASGGNIIIGGNISVPSNLAMTTWGNANQLGSIIWASSSFSFTGTGGSGGGSTGNRYSSIKNSLIDTTGIGALAFPGSVAGSTSSGGLYV